MSRTPTCSRSSSSGRCSTPTAGPSAPTRNSPPAAACPERSFELQTPGPQSQSVQELIDRAVVASAYADQTIAELQDSMLPVEVGDTELRAGLAQVRESLASVSVRRAEPGTDGWALDTRLSVAALRGAADPWARGWASPRRNRCPPTAAPSRPTRSACTRAARSRCSTRTAGRSPPSTADSLGGVVFRDVKPGQRLPDAAGRCALGPADRVQRPPGAAEHQDLRPDDPGQRLRLPDHPRRDQARDRRPPARPGPARTRRWSSTPATATPTRPGAQSGISQIATAARVRGRRRQHARHRLLGRLVRLLRAAAEPRRLRRDRDRRPSAVGPAPQGRDARDLLRRASASCSSPRPIRRTWRRSRRCRRSTTPPRRCTRAGSSTPASRVGWGAQRGHDAEPASPTGGQAWALPADPAGRRDLQAQPGPARRGAQRRRARSSANSHYVDRRSPTRSTPVTFVHKIHVPTYLACQFNDEQTGAHCADLAQRLHRHTAQVVHVHQRRPHRLARPGHVRPAATTSSSCTSRAERRISPALAQGAWRR